MKQSKSRLPKFGDWLLRLFARYDDNPHMRGDFDEEFSWIYETKGFVRAWFWYWTHLLRSLPVFIRDIFFWRIAMFKNYLKIALRNLKKQKGYSFINLAGLALGLTCVAFILLYVFDELSFDRFHNNASRIHRIVSGDDPGYMIIQGSLGPMISKQIPEIEDFTRLYCENVWGRQTLVKYKGTQFFSKHFFLADPSILEIFSFPLLMGDPITALTDRLSIVISESMAERIFGSENPMGKVLNFYESFDFIVTGVMKDIPHNSHLHLDFIVPLENYEIIMDAPGDLTSWQNAAFATYVLLSGKADIKNVEEKMAASVEEFGPNSGVGRLRLQPLTDIHLRSRLHREFEVNGDIRHVTIFSAVALLVLFIAYMNYVNLSTARSLTRAKEVGLRKVVGARRAQLIKQFLGESVLMSFMALWISLGSLYLFMPFFNLLSEKDISFSWFFDLKFVLASVLFVGSIGFIAGLFPALLLSSYQPKSILSGRLRIGKGGSEFARRCLVIIQFAISIGLIACTGIIFKQMTFIRTSDLGFDKEQIVVIHTNRNPEAIQKVPVVIEEFKKIPNVLNISASSHTPGIKPYYRSFRLLDESTDVENIIMIMSLWVDPNFITTYKLELIAGREFSEDLPTDKTSSFIINEAALKACGWTYPQQALGKRVYSDNRTAKIIGVVKDFHFLSLHTRIEPMFLHYNTNRFYAVSAKINTREIRSTISAFKTQWKKILPNVPFTFTFLDEQFAEQYRADKAVGRFLGIFSILAVIISCLGLFGLALFSTHRRTKEIGIRKVLGASVSQVVFMLYKESIRWVLAANLIAWPIAYYAMRRWLQGFSYRINIGLLSFILGGAVALLIALLTVSFQAIRTATANPVDSLRYE